MDFYVLLAIFLVLLTCFVLRSRKYDSYPPGPIPFPIVGSLPYLSNDMVRSFDRLSLKYGKIFSLRIGSFDAIVLNNFEDIKEAFNDDAMNGRPGFHLMRMRCEGNNGILFADGPNYQEMRRFTLRNLRDLGFGKSTLESTIGREIENVEAYLNGYTDRAVDLQNKFNIAVVNALWTITTGERFAIDDPKAKSVIEKLTLAIQSASLTSARHFFPLLRHIWPPIEHDLKWRMSLINEIKNLLNDSINEHRESFEGKDDFISVFLDHAKKSKDGSPFSGEQGDVQLRIILLDLFMAGAETTSTTLTWFFLLMATHPDVQSKVQAEIDDVVGRDRKPALSDRSKLRYTEACIQETLRYVGLVPFTTHRLTENVRFHGYAFPKDVLIFANIHNALHDPSVWERPEEFYPEHFLSGEKVPDAFIAFGTGKRLCLGETLARMELILFVAQLLHSFSFVLPDGETGSLKPVNANAIVRAPFPHKLIVKSRR